MSRESDNKEVISFILGLAAYFFMIHILIMPVVTEAGIHKPLNCSDLFKICPDALHYGVGVLSYGVLIFIIPLLAIATGMGSHWIFGLPEKYVKKIHYKEIENEKRKLREEVKSKKKGDEK